MSEAELARISLGRLLQQLRESVDMTQEQVGKELWTSGTTVHRMEQGKSAVKGPELEALLRVFDVTDDGLRKRLLRLAKRGQQRDRVNGRYRDILSPAALDFFGWEAVASSIRDLQLGLIPGLLQIPEYTRQLITGVQGIRDDVEKFVESRRERQRNNIDRPDNPPQCSFIIDESVLYRPFGSENEMRKQLQHLQDVDERPHVSIQILPLAGGATPALRGSFILLEFDDEYPDVLFIESARGDANVLEPEATKARRAVWDLIAREHVARESLEYYVRRALDRL